MADENLLRFACPACHSDLTVEPGLAGKQVRCPGCHAAVTAPIMAQRDQAGKRFSRPKCKVPVVVPSQPETEFVAMGPTPNQPEVILAEIAAEGPRLPRPPALGMRKPSKATPAIILDSGKETPWRRAGRLWGKLSHVNRLSVCLAGGLLLLIVLAVANLSERFAPISYEEFAAKQAKTDELSIYEIHPGLNGYKPWSQLTDAQKRKCWEWEVAYERSHNTPEARAERERAAVQGGRYGRPWLNTPEARAERKRAVEAATAAFLRQPVPKAQTPYPYPIGSDPKELGGRDFAAP